MTEDLHAIQSAFRLTGVSINDIRLYEKEGLLIPYIAKSGRRWYTDNDLQKIRSIRELLRKGKTCNDVLRLAALIPCWSFPSCKKRGQIDAVCEGKQDFLQPCWILTMVRRVPEQECRLCEVYARIEDYADISSLLPPQKSR
ncbi:MAG: MerR family transcriptional regulator [Candidatus Delongbacteria bacterium]|nr:MerR family transcriptional regulator [Candidatus Delongbacteria bacterium]